LSSLEKFGTAVKSFSPHLVIVSGLQMLDNFPFEPGMLCMVYRYVKLSKWSSDVGQFPI